MKLLLLGGTADARRMAVTLQQQGVKLIYSVAGLVRKPSLPCEIISGGFSQFGGLATYIQQHNIGAILDVTHPYARLMSNTAVSVAKQEGIPCWRFCRQPWLKSEEDQWLMFDTWTELLPALKNKKTLLLTAGQVEETQLNSLLANELTETVILRTAAEPTYPMPENVIWIKAIGPFTLADERQLLRHYQVDALVSKNSGGSAIIAKIHAAAELKIPVYMLARPVKNPAEQQFLSTTACSEFVVSQCHQRSLTLNNQ